VNLRMAAAEHEYEYDLIVVGGGSGGLACSKEAARFGKKVAVLDYVDPSPAGTQWGLGGTCVNVGCIPKKLMHQAALLGEAIHDAKEYGWEVEKGAHKWEKLVEGVQDHIGSLNWGYRTELRSAGVTYINAKGRFLDAHTVECTDKKGKATPHTAARFVVCVGGRPKYLDIEGDRELCITSDDLFSRPKPPGKTLCVGASYVSLECAGFLTGLGYDTTVMARSIFLRGFDQDCAEKIVENMGILGTKFIRGAVPKALAKDGDRVKVTWQNTDGSTGEDVYDTVLLAVGRYAVTGGLGLEELGVKMDASGKIVGGGPLPGSTEQSSVEHIYALGDCLKDRPELTPVAIQAGRLLARRLYDGDDTVMDYVNVATTVFTPTEYGCVGLTEEEAIAKYGEDDVEVYLSNYKPLEYTVAHRGDNLCRVKVICVISEFEAIVGMHIIGANAGEVIQGFGMAIKLGITKKQLDNLVGIHPTSAEEFTTVTVTRRSGQSADKKGC